MKSVCRIYRNDTPARFTGNYLRWICETPEGRVYCETRETAREVAREYNNRQKEITQ